MMSDQESNEVTGLQLSNNTYNNFKFVVQIVLPAAGVLYASLSEFWGFPKVQEVVGTISALALFLGVILRISSASFAKAPRQGTPDGSFIITQDLEGNKAIRLELDTDPAEFIDGKQTIVLRARAAE